MEVNAPFKSLRKHSQYPVEVFQSDLRQICGAFDLSTPPIKAGRVRGGLAVNHQGGLDIANVSLDAKSVTRTTQNIRHDPGNHYFLVLQHLGQAQLIQNEVVTLANPGDMFVVDSTQESQFNYGGKLSQQISVHLPREEMKHRFGRRIYGGLDIDGRDPLAMAMKAILAKLMSSTDMSMQPNTVEAFYSVFGALLTERAVGNGGVVNPDRQIVQSALSLMAEQYKAQEFNSQALADLSGVSLRRLQRAFQVTDETPHDRLQRFRVESAHQILQASAAENLAATVSSVAFSVGFAELSTFYRLYRKRYGCAPGDTRLSNNRP
jgi:AraC-like DNA-binding protein